VSGGDRASLVEALTSTIRVGSLAWKVLAGIATAAGIVWTAALAYSAKSAEYAKVDDVDAKLVVAAKAASDATAKVAGDVKELQAVDAAHAAEREREQQAKAAERAQWIAVFKHLVSLQAADLEPNAARKFAASAHARTAYTRAINEGLSPADAAELALDSNPPWRVK
jgi:hypothetical protein